jgi:hypothetical protein
MEIISTISNHFRNEHGKLIQFPEEKKKKKKWEAQTQHSTTMLETSSKWQTRIE